MLSFTNENGFLDISFQEDDKGQGAVANWILTDSRIPQFLIKDGEQFFDRGGSVGDLLLDANIVPGSLINYYKQTKSTNEIKKYVTNELNIKLNQLKLLGYIQDFTIESVYVYSRNIIITFYYKWNNKSNKLTINI